MENAFIFKPTDSNGLTPGQVIKATAAHARNHADRTLFTIGHSVDLKKWGDELEYFIATTGNGRTALVGRIVDLGDYEKQPTHTPPAGFEQPSQWQPNDKKTWFALDSVREMRIDQDVPKNDDGRDGLEMIGRPSRAYVNWNGA